MIDKLKNIINPEDVQNDNIFLWVFKKNGPQKPIKINGHWVDTTETLERKLKSLFFDNIKKINEVFDYGPITQNNELSALHIREEETNFNFISHICGNSEINDRKVKNHKTIINSEFYIIKISTKNGNIYAAKKTNNGWKSKSKSDNQVVFFKDKKLTIADNDSFDISHYIDFIVYDGDIFVLDKKNFESILNYKAIHQNDFHKLQNEPEFISIFTNISPLISNIGDNTIHLRRMSSIKQKGLYKNKNFISNVRSEQSKYHIKINFDDDGRIIPCDETWKDIVRVLLDHRLQSPFSSNIYNVQDTQPI